MYFEIVYSLDYILFILIFFIVLDKIFKKYKYKIKDLYHSLRKFNKIVDKTQISKYNINCYGEIAQLARATGSYPVGRWFESISRYQNFQEIGSFFIL